MSQKSHNIAPELLVISNLFCIQAALQVLYIYLCRTVRDDKIFVKFSDRLHPPSKSSISDTEFVCLVSGLQKL